MVIPKMPSEGVPEGSLRRGLEGYEGVCKGPEGGPIASGGVPGGALRRGPEGPEGVPPGEGAPKAPPKVASEGAL